MGELGFCDHSGGCRLCVCRWLRFFCGFEMSISTSLLRVSKLVQFLPIIIRLTKEVADSTLNHEQILSVDFSSGLSSRVSLQVVNTPLSQRCPARRKTPKRERKVMLMEPNRWQKPTLLYRVRHIPFHATPSRETTGQGVAVLPLLGFHPPSFHPQ